MALYKKKFGSKSLKREIEFIVALAVLVGLLVMGVYIGFRGSGLNLDLRREAAGKTYFVDSSNSLQDAINKASDSDAIFLKVGTYSTTNPDGFVIKNKKIQILGAGRDFVKIQATNNSYVFNVENSNVKFDGITITGANKDGIHIKNEGKHEIVIKNSAIENNSGNGISSDSKTTISTSSLTLNGTGISTIGDLYVDNTLIENSTAEGIYIESTSKSNSRIVNTIIQNNKGKGILIAGGNNHIIKNVTLYKNDSGIVETASNTKSTITNTIIQSSKKEGISLKSSDSTFTYSNAFGNGTDFSPAELRGSEGNLSVDSKFTSDTDVHLTKSTSPVRNKGLSSEKNNDGTRIDLGAFGGNPNLTASNAAPTISSTPPKYIHPGQKFTYELKASDPDNDPLIYTVINSNAPKWISQKDNVFTGTPTASQVGFWSVVVVVSDQKGHNVVHPISINVIPQNRSVPQPNVTTPTQSPITQVAQISFTSPKAGSVISNENNEIRWSVTNNVAIDKFVLKYSDDKENYKTITTLPGDATSYKWTDVEKLTPGKYLLQIEATDKNISPVTIKQISEEFEITHTTKNPNVQNIVITKNSPPDDDNSKTRRPLIAVEFKPDAELDPAKTYLKINDKNVDYKFTRNTIYYDTPKDFEGTRVRVEAKIVTKDSAEATRQWIFNLPIVANPNDTKRTVTSTDQVLGLPRPIGLLLIALFVIIILLGILYGIAKLLKTIRDERQGNLEAEFTEYYDIEHPQQTQVTTQTTYPIIEADTSNENTYVQNEYIVEPTQENIYVVDEQQHPVQTVQTTTETIEISEMGQPVDSYDQTVVTNDQTQITTTNNEEYRNDITPSNQLVEKTSETIITSNDPQETNQTQSTETSDYIKQLKERYGISNENTTQGEGESNDASHEQPDPTNASTHPKKS